MASSPRASRTRRGASCRFGAAVSRATFFVLGWVAEHQPGLVARSPPAPRDAATATSRDRLRIGPARFRDDLKRARTATEPPRVRSSGLRRRASRSPRTRSWRSTSCRESSSTTPRLPDPPPPLRIPRFERRPLCSAPERASIPSSRSRPSTSAPAGRCPAAPYLRFPARSPRWSFGKLQGAGEPDPVSPPGGRH